MNAHDRPRAAVAATGSDPPLLDARLPGLQGLEEIRVTGAFDRPAQAELEEQVHRLGRRDGSTQPVWVAHIDLRAVDTLDAAGLRSLNRVHDLLIGRGWIFRITPPDPLTARHVFLSAAIEGSLHWA